MSGYKILEKICKDLPNLPGSYRMIDINGEILYIGKAKNIKKRVLSYLKNDLPNRLKRMVYLTDNLEYTITKNEAEAFLLEASLIKKFQPKYNIVLKDDKSFPYIQLTVEKDFPQILKYRGKNLKNGKFFGPFASSYDVDQTIQTLQKIFKIRSCSDSYFASRKRPCLQYQIKRCSAPCTNKISKEDYDNLIKQVLYFLNGKDSQLQVELGKLMTIYAEKMEYELAAEIRDRIKALTYVQLKSSISNSGVSDSDVIAICRDSSHFVIQVFMYRGAKATGGRAYFPRYVEDADDTEVISSFLGQFYQTRICPGEILLNIDIGEENTTILKDALYSLYKVKTNILSPKRGAKMNLIEHAVNNAKEALKHHVSKESKNIKNLEKIQQIFHLPKIPERIEIYDNSHIMGKFAVGAIVVAGIDGFIKNEYRKYNLDIDSKGDDYGMLREVIEKRTPEVLRKDFISLKNLQVVKEGMKQTTVIGTARSLQTLPVSSGAKTGTAQTSKPGINHNWVSVFAPYDEPEIVMTVIIEEVKGVTPVATHLARDILTEYFLSKE